jgi:osmoprotectant transport system ATP-binding protein
VSEPAIDHTPDNKGASIELANVTKRFPGQDQAAVDDLTMTIPAGEIVVLLGPSGCGKTTTMRLMNRLIEPTSGRILIGGEDVLRRDANDLRRHIGYVIQNAGLFPHMTVGTNIAQVPQMLGWSRQRTAARVDELLDLVGLDPAEFRDRFPRRLSGGQQQRVGVARALAADPPALLMDEPFGALDPITREKLQDELLRLQDELGKTIVFVTHDVDEALKIGDRIAIMRTGAKIVQYAPPQEILVNPADDYVEEFLGGGSAMRLLKLSKVADVPLESVIEVTTQDDTVKVRESIEAAGTTFALVLGPDRRPLHWVTLDLLDGSAGPIGDRGTPLGDTIPARATLQDALNALVQADHRFVPVIGRRGVHTGVVTLETLQDAIVDIKKRERERRSA